MTAQSNSPPSMTVSFKEALKFWTKLGFISFGGPAGQISIMHQEVVELQQWIGENQFLRALNSRGIQRLALHPADVDRPRSGRIHPWPIDHGNPVRWFFGGLELARWA